MSVGLVSEMSGERGFGFEDLGRVTIGLDVRFFEAGSIGFLVIRNFHATFETNSVVTGYGF